MCLHVLGLTTASLNARVGAWVFAAVTKGGNQWLTSVGFLSFYSGFSGGQGGKCAYVFIFRFKVCASCLETKAQKDPEPNAR